MDDSSTTQKKESEETLDSGDKAAVKPETDEADKNQEDTKDQKRSMEADKVFIRLPKFHFSLIKGAVFTGVDKLLKNIGSVDLKVTNYMSDIIDNFSGYIKNSKEDYKRTKKNI